MSKLKKDFTKEKGGKFSAKRSKGDFLIWKDQRGYKWRYRAYGETIPKEIRWASTLENAMLACQRHFAWEEKIAVSALIDRAMDELKLITEEKKQTLLQLFNVVESDIARDYFPIKATQKVDTISGVIAYKDFDYAAYRILGVFDECGSSCHYSLNPTYLKTVPGTVRITYMRGTKAKAIDGESDYSMDYFDLLAFGLLNEYATMNADFEQAEIYGAAFKNEIKKIYDKLAKEKKTA